MRFLVFMFLSMGCRVEVVEPVPDEPAPLSAEVLASLSVERLRDDVAVLAADEMGGRTPGSYGHELARNYILAEMESSGMIPIRLDGSFIQEYENDPIAGRYQMEPDGSVIPSNVTGGTNLIGVIPGSDPVLADEYVVLMAHYDHLGVTQTGEVYNGAFDNATSVAMALEIARVFTEHDIQPKRTIVFLITDDEESGLDGAQAWLEDPEVPLGDVVLGLSADPTGRPVLPDFWPIVLIGLERSPSLLARMKKTRRYSELPVFFVHRDVVPVFSSDHDRFFAWQDPIAAGWYTNPGMSFYHTVDDTPETIDYRVLGANTRYLAQVLVDLGGDDQRYPYEGEFPVDGSTAQDLKELFEGVLASIELSTRERERTEYFISEIDRVVEADSVDVLDNPDSLFFAGAYFLLFELTYAHPGEVPPPFPSENE